MKYLVTDYIDKQEKEKLQSKGLFCYELRDSDSGNDIASIEKRVMVNNVGAMITNEEIPLGDKYPDDFVDYNTFVEKNKCVFTIGELLGESLQRKDKDVER